MKLINKFSILTLFLPVLCLSGCQKEEVLDKPVGFGEDREVIETTTANAGFSIDLNSEFSVGSSNQEVYQYDPVYIQEENLYENPNLSQDEIDAYYEVAVDPITGEDVSISRDLHTLQTDAKDIYKPLYESGELPKEDVEMVINSLYADLPDEDREKVLSEIFSSDKEVEVIETESVIEETISQEEFNQIIADLNASGKVFVSDGSGSGGEHLFDEGGGTSGSDGMPPMVSN